MSNEVRYDSAGRAIRIGDTVAAAVPTTCRLEVCKVDSFTPKNVRLNNGETTFLRTFAQVIRVDFSPEDLVLGLKNSDEC